MSDWLASRAPAPPDELSARLIQIAGDSNAPPRDLPSILLAQALVLLAEVGDDRAAAPDLLAADALITYAMEAAAESGSIEEAAEAAMRAIGDIK